MISTGQLGWTWPLAASMALVVVSGRVRSRRRRAGLNRALHELRRPLQTLTLAPPGTPAASSSLELALVALADLDAQVNGTGSRLRLRPVSARAVVEASVERWRAPAARAGRTLELRWRAGSASLMADPARAAQLLDNLLSNCIEHGGLRLFVTASARGGRLHVTIADSGRLAPSHVRSPRHGPAGHGLAVAAAIAAAHGGSLSVEASGGGTIARVELPLAPQPLASAAPPEVARNGTGARSPAA